MNMDLIIIAHGHFKSLPVVAFKNLLITCNTTFTFMHLADTFIQSD